MSSYDILYVRVATYAKKMAFKDTQSANKAVQSAHLFYRSRIHEIIKAHGFLEIEQRCGIDKEKIQAILQRGEFAPEKRLCLSLEKMFIQQIYAT